MCSCKIDCEEELPVENTGREKCGSENQIKPLASKTVAKDPEPCKNLKAKSVEDTKSKSSDSCASKTSKSKECKSEKKREPTSKCLKAQKSKSESNLNEKSKCGKVKESKSSQSLQSSVCEKSLPKKAKKCGQTAAKISDKKPCSSKQSTKSKCEKPAKGSKCVKPATSKCKQKTTSTNTPDTAEGFYTPCAEDVPQKAVTCKSKPKKCTREKPVEADATKSKCPKFFAADYKRSKCPKIYEVKPTRSPTLNDGKCANKSKSPETSDAKSASCDKPNDEAPSFIKFTCKSPISTQTNDPKSCETHEVSNEEIKDYSWKTADVTATTELVSKVCGRIKNEGGPKDQNSESEKSKDCDQKSKSQTTATKSSKNCEQKPCDTFKIKKSASDSSVPCTKSKDADLKKPKNPLEAYKNMDFSKSTHFNKSRESGKIKASVSIKGSKSSLADSTKTVPKFGSKNSKIVKSNSCEKLKGSECPKTAPIEDKEPRVSTCSSKESSDPAPKCSSSEKPQEKCLKTATDKTKETKPSVCSTKSETSCKSQKKTEAKSSTEKPMLESSAYYVKCDKAEKCNSENAGNSAAKKEESVISSSSPKKLENSVEKGTIEKSAGQKIAKSSSEKSKDTGPKASDLQAKKSNPSICKKMSSENSSNGKCQPENTPQSAYYVKCDKSKSEENLGVKNSEAKKSECKTPSEAVKSEDKKCTPNSKSEGTDHQTVKLQAKESVSSICSRNRLEKTSCGDEKHAEEDKSLIGKPPCQNIATSGRDKPSNSVESKKSASEKPKETVQETETLTKEDSQSLDSNRKASSARGNLKNFVKTNSILDSSNKQTPAPVQEKTSNSLDGVKPSVAKCKTSEKSKESCRKGGFQAEEAKSFVCSKKKPEVRSCGNQKESDAKSNKSVCEKILASRKENKSESAENKKSAAGKCDSNKTVRDTHQKDVAAQTKESKSFRCAATQNEDINDVEKKSVDIETTCQKILHSARVKASKSAECIKSPATKCGQSEKLKDEKLSNCKAKEPKSTAETKAKEESCASEFTCQPETASKAEKVKSTASTLEKSNEKNSIHTSKSLESVVSTAAKSKCEKTAPEKAKTPACSKPKEKKCEDASKSTKSNNFVPITTCEKERELNLKTSTTKAEEIKTSTNEQLKASKPPACNATKPADASEESCASEFTCQKTCYGSGKPETASKAEKVKSTASTWEKCNGKNSIHASKSLESVVSTAAKSKCEKTAPEKAKTPACSKPKEKTCEDASKGTKSNFVPITTSEKERELNLKTSTAKAEEIKTSTNEQLKASKSPACNAAMSADASESLESKASSAAQAKCEKSASVKPKAWKCSALQEEDTDDASKATKSAFKPCEKAKESSSNAPSCKPDEAKNSMKASKTLKCNAAKLPEAPKSLKSKASPEEPPQCEKTSSLQPKVSKCSLRKDDNTDEAPKATKSALNSKPCEKTKEINPKALCSKSEEMKISTSEQLQASKPLTCNVAKSADYLKNSASTAAKPKCEKPASVETKTSKCSAMNEDRPADASKTCESKNICSPQQQTKSSTCDDKQNKAKDLFNNVESAKAQREKNASTATASGAPSTEPKPSSVCKAKLENTSKSTFYVKCEKSESKPNLQAAEAKKSDCAKSLPSSNKLQEPKACAQKTNLTKETKQQPFKPPAIERKPCNPDAKKTEPDLTSKTKTCDKFEPQKSGEIKSASNAKTAGCNKSKSAATPVKKYKTKSAAATVTISCGRYMRADKVKPVRGMKSEQQKCSESSQPSNEGNTDSTAAKTGCNKDPVTTTEKNQTQKSKPVASGTAPSCKKGGAGSGSGGQNSQTPKSRTFRNISFAAIAAVMGFCGYTFMTIDHKGRPDFVPYEYLYRRNKRFPWGDGTKSFFHNSEVNALPTGYEEDETTNENENID